VDVAVVADADADASAVGAGEAGRKNKEFGISNGYVEISSFLIPSSTHINFIITMEIRGLQESDALPVNIFAF